MNYAGQLQSLLDAVVGTSDTFSHPRFRVYADGYSERLKAAVREDYPGLQAFMGPEGFEDVVAAYVAATPSRYWDLNTYALGLGDVVPSGAAHDLARLESAISEVFWLPDSDPLGFDYLSGIDEDALGAQVFQPRAASRLLKFEFGVNAYLTAFRAGEAATMTKTCEHLLVVRHDNEVHRHPLEAMEYDLLKRLSEGMHFGAALNGFEALADRLPTYLSAALNRGAWQRCQG